MVMFTKANGSMTRLMVRVPIPIWMELNTTVTGRRTNNMGLVSRHGQMVQNMRAIMNMGRSMVPVHSSGQMAPSISENSIIITSMARESIHGVTAENTKANGETTRCTEKVPLLGLMAENMWENMLMIKSRAMVNSSGLMVAPTREIG
jgi:hypothetical protein